MTRYTLVAACLVGGLLSCGSPPQPTTPATEPEAAEPKAAEPESTEPTEAEATEASEPEAKEPPPPAAPAEPPRQPCVALEKARCRIAQGCAWYEKGGKGECVDED